MLCLENHLTASLVYKNPHNMRVNFALSILLPTLMCSLVKGACFKPAEPNTTWDRVQQRLSDVQSLEKCLDHCVDRQECMGVTYYQVTLKHE